MPQPCGAFAMRSRALPEENMMTTKYNCTLVAFFFLSRHSIVAHGIPYCVPQSSCPPTRPGRWLPRKLSSRSSSWVMPSRCRPTCPASPIHEYPPPVQLLFQVVHPYVHQFDSIRSNNCCPNTIEFALSRIQQDCLPFFQTQHRVGEDKDSGSGLISSTVQ